MIRFSSTIWFCFVYFFGHSQNKIPTVEEVLTPVYTQAVNENKNVLLLFRASWCGWCRKMDTLLQKAEIKPLIDKNLVTTHLTVYESAAKKNLENPGSLQFLTKHGGADKGIPYWLILDKNGNVLANSEYEPNLNSGCPATEKEVAYFISILKKTSSLNEKDLKIIEKRFRINDQRSANVQLQTQNKLKQ